MTRVDDASPRHAPRDLLQAASCGGLGPAASIAVQIHARHCADCAARMSALESIGGALLDAQEDAAFDVETSLDAVLARLQDHRPARKYSEDVAAAPDELRPAFAAALERGRWSYAGPGLRTLDLDLPGAAESGEFPQLLRIEPGYGAPRHSHSGIELTLVLDGAFKDQTGVYRRGDLAVATDALTHRPVAEPGRVCLAYAVSFAPMRFTGLFGMAQRLLTRWRQ